MRRAFLLLIFWSFSSHAAVNLTTGSLTAANTFIRPAGINGGFNFSRSGACVATTHLQRSFDNGLTWLDVASYTGDFEDRGTENESGVAYRVGIKAGNYTSGTCALRISQ